MNKTSWIRALGLVCALALVVVGCGGGEGGSGDARQGEFDVLKQQREGLQAKRQEIADLQAQIAAVPEDDAEAEEGGEEGEEGEVTEPAGPTAEELQAQLEQAQGELAALSEDFMGALVMFLNSADMVQGEAPTGTTLDAIRMKSAEDMLIADEYIYKGGDYRRAKDILDTALMLDPDNPDLQAARAKAEADQYMTAERFEPVSKGMTQEEVRKILGTVNPNNVRDYPDKDVTAWFYRREDKGAAGVYFQEKDGEQVVYRVDFDAVKANEEPGDEG